MDIAAVRLENTATPAEVRAVTDVLREADIDAEVRADWQKEPYTGNGAFWMVIVVLTVTLGPFLNGFLGKAGADAWEAFKEFALNMRAARSTPGGWLKLEDPDGTSVMISGDEPPEAFDLLAGIDWTEHRGGTVMWHYTEGRWYDPEKEYGS